MCFLGNIVVLIVFARSKRMHTRTNLFLANLAVADFCVGVFCVLPTLSTFLSRVWVLGQVMCKLYYFVNYLAYTASILLLAVIAVERYIAIMHPLRSRRFFTAPRLFVAQGVVWGIAAVYNIPILLMIDTHPTQNGWYCFLTPSDFDMTAYYTCHFALWYLLPLLVILTVYGRISCTLWATSAAAAADDSGYHRSTGSTSVSVTVDANYQLHSHNHGNASPRTALMTSNPGRTCVTYCEPLGDNGFGSVVKVGGARNGSDGGANGRNGRVDTLSRSSPPSSGSAEGVSSVKFGGVSSGRGQCGAYCCEAGRGCQHSPIYQTKGVNEHIEMVPLTGRCDGHHASQNSRCSKLAKEDTNDASDATSSDDFENRSPGGTSADMKGVNEYSRGGSFNKGSSGGAAAAPAVGSGGGGVRGRRRLKYHCRVSTQRGLASRRRVIRLLMAVVTVFGVCVLPFHVRNLLHYWHVSWPVGGVLDYLPPIAYFMLYLNSGLNPFIYWMFSDHFRRSLKETLCFWRRTRCSSSRLAQNSPCQKQNAI
ncbi:trissin receptor-like [Pomacea canaliculata]|uniref:trissin receptor-like n=1 Tax=Pomacea canaliculata TaxID=400727 RepID=UPI000D73667E|nr:trissin receptor-like [Pomacea canaliculata]